MLSGSPLRNLTGEIVSKTIIRFKAEIIQKPRYNILGVKKWSQLASQKLTRGGGMVLGLLLGHLSKDNRRFVAGCLHNSRTPGGTGQLSCVTTEPPGGGEGRSQVRYNNHHYLPWWIGVWNIPPVTRFPPGLESLPAAGWGWGLGQSHYGPMQFPTGNVPRGMDGNESNLILLVF